jgi:DNA-binding XRE family transcriptional regulator
LQRGPISQEELGLRAGVAKKTIGEIERGVTNSKFETLLMISKAPLWCSFATSTYLLVRIK